MTEPFSSCDRNALAKDVGWGAADEICREIPRTLKALRKNPVAAIWHAERDAFVAAEQLMRALRNPELEASLLPGKERLLAELDELIPFLRASSRKERGKATKRRQRTADRRNVEYVFLGVLERHGVPHGGARAARALALVLGVTLDLRASDDPEIRLRSLMRARASRRAYIKETRLMQQVLDGAVATPRST